MTRFEFKRLRFSIFPVLLVFLAVSNNLAALLPEPSPREDQLGDAHPALADDFSTVFSNPAGIATIEPVHRFAQIDLRLSGTFWNVFNAFEGKDPEDLFPVDTGDYIGLGLLGPIDVGYAGNHSAYRLNNYVTLDVLYPNLAVQSIFTAAVGAQLTGGWGRRFSLGGNTTLDFGFTAKAFYEQRYFGEADIVEFFGLFEDPENFLDYPYEVIPGVGLDSSILFKFGPQWAVGFTATDLLTLDFVTHYDTLRSSIDGNSPDSISTQVRLPLISVGGGWFPAFTDNIKWFNFDGVYLSWRNLLGGLETYPYHYLLGLTAGIEISFWDFLALRGGFAEGIFGGGIGLRLGFFSLDIGVGGSELSNQPGVFSVVDIRVAFTFESRKLGFRRQ